MRKQAFGPFQVSVIGLGSVDFGGRIPERAAREFMDAYTEMGGNFLDTAHVYGDFVTPRNGASEEVIGRWMRDRKNRDRIFLSTKGAHPALGNMQASRLGREEILRDMEESLDALQTDHTDIYFLHRDDPSRDVGEIMETLHSLVESGRTVMIGVSNWTPERITAANAYADAHGLTGLSANQPQYSLAAPVAMSDRTLAVMNARTWKMHRDTQMACTCFSSQAHAFFQKLDAGGEAALPERVKAEFYSGKNTACLERIRKVREETGYSVGAVALAYLTSQPFPTFALAGASRLYQVEALREAGDAVLTQEQCAFLRNVAEEDR